MDEARQPLSRKLPISSSRINPYRLIILLRLVILGLFFHYRILHPVKDAYGLWLTSVICEIWFAVSWILDQFPKWYPIERETYLDRLSLRWCRPPSSFNTSFQHLSISFSINENLFWQFGGFSVYFGMLCLIFWFTHFQVWKRRETFWISKCGRICQYCWSNERTSTDHCQHSTFHPCGRLSSR